MNAWRAARRNLGDVLAAVFVVALVYVLVRPRSDGPALIVAMTSAFVAVVSSVTDLASTAGN